MAYNTESAGFLVLLLLLIFGIELNVVGLVGALEADLLLEGDAVVSGSSAVDVIWGTGASVILEPSGS